MTRATRNRIVSILHRSLSNGDVSAMFKRTLILSAVGIWIIFALCVLLAWGLRG